MEQQYTNELTPDVLACQDVSPFSPEQLAEMSDEARALIEEQKVFCRSHPVNAIFRIATDGSLTRDGGIVRAADTGHQLMLDDGSYANVARAGDEVAYPDGRTAKVVTGAGEASAIDGTGVALVGSQLDNGDEIISTPQGHSWLVRREGVPMCQSFLAEEA
ncbi:PAAR domain-containing protein [Pantoea stewartii]|uniref:PAAR domain-containing protein n=1 Tax=Pantoea stewartii TaxID=66269 RepID=UPI001625F3E6|nr:PAAR domain-containing protein [Pantoea stewartii]MBC0856774.1 PAAR domain-containing protein [Pantoea stewartii]UYK98887.1 hypothetical protein NG832_07805 [Pantoea stewartii]